jgi:hypothetical protein
VSIHIPNWEFIQRLSETGMWLDITVRMTDQGVSSEWVSVNEARETISKEASFFFFIAFHQKNLPVLCFVLWIHITAFEPSLPIVIDEQNKSRC